MNTYKIIKIFKEFLAKHPRHFVVLLLLLVTEGLIAIGAVIAIVPFADFLVDPLLEKPSKITSFVLTIFTYLDIEVNFWAFGMFFVGFNLLNGGLKVVIRYAILKIKYVILRRLFNDTLSMFFKARWLFFSESNHGSLLNTMNKELNTIGDTVGNIAAQFAQLIQLIVYLAVPIWLNASMTITAISLAFIFGLPFLLLNKLSYRLGKLNTSTANVAMGVLSEMLQSARIILGFGRQDNALSRYLKAFEDHIDVTIKSQTLVIAIPVFFVPLGMLASVIALGVSFQQQDPIAELTAVMWSLLSAMPILSSLLQTNTSINNFIPSYEQLLLLRNRAEKYKEINGNKQFKSMRKGIEFRNVYFSYPSREDVILGVNIHIQKGKMVALVGGSGSGKSTITDLVLGLQVPNRGKVLVDNEPISQYEQKSFREKIGYVPQEPILFHASIRDNLLWAYNCSDETELWNALKMANADGFVKQLPQGLDTVVGDRGNRMSGGQKQRIALARALLRKPELLILDEATSALDRESEILIQKSVEKLADNMTILVVAHRLSTIKKSDKVYVLQNGRVEEEGSYPELSAKVDGVFYSMLQRDLV